MDRDTMTFISQEVERQLANSTSRTTAAEAIAHTALTTARDAQQGATKAQTDAGAALAVAGAAHQNSKVAKTAADTALAAKLEQDKHFIDLMYAHFKDFFHDALLRYLDYNRKDYDKTLRDWAFAKVTAWTKK